MALRWIEGFETFGATSTPRTEFFPLISSKYEENALGTGTALVAGYRSEGIALALNNSYSSLLRKSFDAQATWVIGLAFNCDNTNSFHEELITLSDYTNEQVQVRLNEDRYLQFLRSNTVLETSPTTYSLNTWYYLELKVTIGNSGSYEVRIDGTTVLSGTGVDTQDSSSNAWANNLVLGPMYGAIDDLYVLDGSAGQNDFLGPCKVRVAFPVSDDAQSDWTPSGGTSHYALLDEVPSGSDYVASQTLDDLDFYEVSDAPSGDIAGAMMLATACLDKAGGKSFSMVVDSGGSQDSEPFSLCSDQLSVCTLLSTEDPQTSSPWTHSAINVAKWGIKII